MFNRILVPVDGSVHAERAVDIASELAQRFGAELTLVHVLTHSGRYTVPEALESYSRIEHIRVTERDLIESAGQEILTNAKTQAVRQGAGNCKTVLESGDPASKIAQIAESEGADLIVMGRRGLGDLSGLLFGSVSHKVAQAVDCCCLTVK